MGEMGKKEKKLTILVFFYITYFTIVWVYTKFEDSGSNSRWEICDEFLGERKKNGQIKKMTSMKMWQRSTRWIYTKYQRPGSSCFRQEDFLSFQLKNLVLAPVT